MKPETANESSEELTTHVSNEVGQDGQNMAEDYSGYSKLMRKPWCKNKL